LLYFLQLKVLFFRNDGGDKVKFSQCKLFGAIVFILGLSLLPGFAFGQNDVASSGLKITHISGQGYNSPAINLVQDIASVSITIEKSSPRVLESNSKENRTTTPAIDLVQDIANVSITLEKSSSPALESNPEEPRMTKPAIDLVQDIAAFPSETSEKTEKSGKISDSGGDGLEIGYQRISEVAQNTTTADIEMKMEAPKMEQPSSSDAEDLPDFNESDDPFGDIHPEYPQIEDPYENYNRFMQGVNDGMYDYMIEPVSTVYRDWVPEFFRLSVKNVFANAASPVNFVSSLLQGDLDKAARVIGRLVLNSTVGLGGLFDVAGDYYEVKPVNEDMEQALGSYDIGSGPYLVLPFFGPSSPRNLVGKVFDSLLNPTFWFSPSFVVGAGITAEERVNSTSFIVDDYKGLKENAVDPYISLRDFNHQYREKLIKE
jgi:phospholipid-binding lipoprotein MlaA